MAAARPQTNDDLRRLPVPAAAAAAQKKPNKTMIVYERNVQRQIRVLDEKMRKLELQLNSEREKISSCSGLLEEIISQPQGSPCASLRAEMDRVRARRERAYHKFQQQQQLEMEIQGGQEHGAPEAAGGAASASASN